MFSRKQALPRLEFYIDGKITDKDASSKKITLTNPATGKSFAETPVAGASAIDHAYTSAAEAFTFWSKQTPKYRAEALFALADAIDENRDELTALEVLSTGQSHTRVRQDFITPCADQLRFFAGMARSLDGLSAADVLPGQTSIIRREPLGVVGQVAPWNYPLMMTIWKIGPALAVGNTSVVKPAETTPLSTLLLAEISQGILPKGVFNVVLGDADTGRLVVEHPYAQQVAITGSIRAGRSVAQSAAKSLKRTHLELGGKSPVIIFPDADLEHAAKTITQSALYNSGQDCTAASRLLVHEDCNDVFLNLIKERFQAAEVGYPHENALVGPVHNRAQLEKITSMVEDAPSYTKIITGGAPMDQPGYFFPPTIIAGVEQEDALVQNEIFGPVVTYQSFRTEKQAIQLANGCFYGLSSSVWTNNVARAFRVAHALDSGTVWVNNHLIFAVEMPHGGFKGSGFGKDMSLYSVQDYTRVKHIMVNTENVYE